MKRGSAPLILIGVAIIIIAAALFLYPYNPTQPPVANSSGWSEEGVKAVVDGNNEFAINAFLELEKTNQDKNVFFSPYSISSAFALVYEGAKGDTASEIADALHFPEKAVLRPNFAWIYNALNNASEEYTLRTGNALWVQKEFPLVKDYVENVEKYYGGKAANLDFKNQPDKSRETINNFISEQTNGKIKNLVPPFAITPDTVLIITNAIYFKGTWIWQFDKAKTSDMEFHTPDGPVTVSMMHMKPDKARFKYADLEKAQFIELPYKGNLSMFILLPKQGEERDIMTGKTKTYNYTLEDLEKDLTLENLESWEAGMQETKLDGIYVPKFKLETTYYLSDILQDMGVKKAFTPYADFSGISPKGIFINFVIHKAYVSVDEEGTEAAAATAIGFVTSASMPRIFRADHPFIFYIKDNKTGEILFMGKVVNPS